MFYYHKSHGKKTTGMTKQVSIDFNILCKKILSCGFPVQIPKNVTFVTYENSIKKTLIERIYNKLNIPHIVLAKNYKPWTWMGKIKPLLSYLESGQCKTKYIIATDSRDVALIKDPKKIVEVFKSFDCCMLFCNTVADWPKNNGYCLFEDVIYCHSCFHRHLSAGAFMAKVSPLKRYLQEIIIGYQNKRKWTYIGNKKFNDQLAWRHMHKKYYPRIQVDADKEIFCRFDSFRHEN